MAGKISLIEGQFNGEGRIVRDLLYGCCCGGKRISNAEYPPLDRLYIATVLKGAGVQASLGACGEAELPEIIVVSSSATTLPEDLGLLNKIKSKNPRCTTLVYGAAATFQTEELLESGAVDFAVIGEPEFTIRALVKEKDRRKWKKIRGIAYSEKGRLKTNANNPMRTMNLLPIPDRKMLQGMEYSHPLITRKPWTTMVTTRGCAGKCTFCLSPRFYGGRIIERSVEKVVEELKILKSEGYTEIFFRDETFTWNRKRTREICERMIEERLELAWIANSKVGTVDRKTLGLMKEAGCEVLKIGVESGNQKILDNIKKGITLRQTEDTFRWTKEAGIRTHAHFMLGCPGETRKTIRETMEFAKKIGPDTATFGILTPYPGTEIFESIKDRIKKTDFSGEHAKAHYNELFTELKGGELEKALKQAYREFYFRPEYILGRLKKVKSIGELKNLIKSGLAVTGFAGS